MGCNKCGGSGGCSSNGGCGSGGCDRQDVYDWLSDLPVADEQDRCKIVEVSFNNGSRKDFFRDTSNLSVYQGDLVAVEGVNGFDVGRVRLSGQLVRLQLKKKGVKEDSPDIKRILRLASDYDIEKWKETKSREKEVLIRSRVLANKLGLKMKISEVEIQADARKATFFYIADDRVDFRELIKQYASEFKVKVEMRQIGARQEAGKIGGISTSGRELCCGSWMTKFKSVNTSAARYQNLSINQSKLTGQCGRLKCCLNFELDTYLDALKSFPDHADTLELSNGRAHLVKKDIFRNLMWYTSPESIRYIPLSIDTVREIIEKNKNGVKPLTLQAEEIINEKPKIIEEEFVDVVGQITLKSLEKGSKKKSRRRGKGNSRNDNQKNKRNRSKSKNKVKDKNS